VEEEKKKGDMWVVWFGVVTAEKLREARVEE
jgi:hypothetical protein